MHKDLDILQELGILHLHLGPLGGPDRSNVKGINAVFHTLPG